MGNGKESTNFDEIYILHGKEVILSADIST